MRCSVRWKNWQNRQAGSLVIVSVSYKQSVQIVTVSIYIYEHIYMSIKHPAWFPSITSLVIPSGLVVRCVHAQSCPALCDPMDCVACQAPLSMEFSKKEYWSGLPFPIPGDLPDPGIEPTSPMFPSLAGRFFYHCTTSETFNCYQNKGAFTFKWPYANLLVTDHGTSYHHPKTDYWVKLQKQSVPF